MEAGEGVRPSNGAPWASVFDSTANMRALSAIQADGFRAASELVDRFVRMAATGLDHYGPPNRRHAAPAADVHADLFGATGLEPFAAAWWSMLDKFLAFPTAHASQAEQLDADEQAKLDLAAATAAGQLHFEAAPAAVATAELWLHNRGTFDLGKVRLRTTGLLAHDGSVLAAESMRFEPDVVPMPPRSSRGVTVELDVAEDAVPGSYRGMLLADGYPDIWLPLDAVITSPIP